MVQQAHGARGRRHFPGLPTRYHRCRHGFRRHGEGTREINQAHNRGKSHSVHQSRADICMV